MQNKHEKFESFQLNHIQEGDYIKCILSNLLGYWNQIQLVCYKVVKYDDLCLRLLQLYRDPDSILEIYNLFKKYDFNLDKLIEHCIRKNQNIYNDIGAVLAGIQFNDIAYQCDCGEIMFYQASIYEKMRM